MGRAIREPRTDDRGDRQTPVPCAHISRHGVRGTIGTGPEKPEPQVWSRDERAGRRTNFADLTEGTRNESKRSGCASSRRRRSLLLAQRNIPQRGGRRYRQDEDRVTGNRD